jgi:ribosomal protein S6--L-glutamate ligase
VLPRIGASITYFGTAVVRQFEQMDVYTPNTAAASQLARQAARLQILSRHDIGIPRRRSCATSRTSSRRSSASAAPR